MFKNYILVLLLLVLSSCATVRPVEDQPKVTEHLYLKNYKIGVKNSSYIGEEIIKLKDYYIVKTPTKAMQAKNDFKITAALSPSYYGNNGATYPIVGEITEDNQNIRLIQIPFNDLRFGINNSGEFADVAIGPFNQKVFGVNYEPVNTKFEEIKDEKIDLSKTFINYEIIFTGITNNSINLLYREYTPENMARSAFFQNLTYPIDSRFIRFKQVKIKIDQIDNEKIIFTVLEDGTT